MGLKPVDLIKTLRKGGKPASGYLFLGAEPFYRSRCKQAIRDAVLGSDPDETAAVEVDLSERALANLIDEARTQSLFVSERLIVGRSAEHAVPRTTGKAAKAEQQMVQDYFKDPEAGTVVVIEATRYDSRDRDEKRKIERVEKFFDSVPIHVELHPLSANEAQFVGKHLARQMGVGIDPKVLASLVDMLGSDAFRIENELQKLSLYAGKDAAVTAADLDALVPEARQSGVFEFSQALAARDRARALLLLDTMSRAGMYWPLQLNLIAGLFRHALAAKELGLRNSRQIGSQLQAAGLSVWPERARQVEGIVSRFRLNELRDALIAIYEADKRLRTAGPDDRVAVEMLVMQLTR